MNNENNVNYVPTETDTTLAVETNVKVLKRQPGLGKLNRLTKQAQDVLFALGHSGNRFKRDYTTGTATYTCSACKATVLAQVSNTRGGSVVSGDGLTSNCTKGNS